MWHSVGHVNIKIFGLNRYCLTVAYSSHDCLLDGRLLGLANHLALHLLLVRGCVSYLTSQGPHSLIFFIGIVVGERHDILRWIFKRSLSALTGFFKVDWALSLGSIVSTVNSLYLLVGSLSGHISISVVVARVAGVSTFFNYSGVFVIYLRLRLEGLLNSSSVVIGSGGSLGCTCHWRALQVLTVFQLILKFG